MYLRLRTSNATIHNEIHANVRLNTQGQPLLEGVCNRGYSSRVFANKEHKQGPPLLRSLTSEVTLYGSL